MEKRQRLLLATNNPGKVREFRRLLARSGFEVVTPGDLGIALEPEETGTTYGENAASKAQVFANAGQCLALADDSGIEVDALGGRPGMYSARFGGPGLDDAARTALLISELHGVPDPKRTARYRAVVALAWPAGREPMLFEGVQEGTIGHEPRGGRGFGYDPVFLVDGVRAQAEISDDEKDLISHRGKAVRAAAEWLASHCP
ncbi:MAG: RdgB/HAM1 family non-canonical purine NTP pyrophosphatase [Dehalococcoidia bacterium]|nr:RdgB/HAM1 family non-canonical purine NTP pyrophosphatase [Dehalococcoidia bacterium]